MNDFLTILIPIVTVIIGVILAAIINIKIKHAKSEKDAFKQLKYLGTHWIITLLLIVVAYLLYREITSNQPITRTTIFSIALYVSMILSLLLLKGISRVFDALTSLLSSHFNKS